MRHKGRNRIKKNERKRDWMKENVGNKEMNKKPKEKTKERAKKEHNKENCHVSPEPLRPPYVLRVQ
jgi:hypothetical protein